MLITIKDWSEFLDQALDKQKNEMLKEKSKQFVDRAIVQGEKPVLKIINEFKAHQITPKQEKNAT